MSKKANILSIIQAHENLSEEGFKNFLRYNRIELKNYEIRDLTALVSLLKHKECNVAKLDSFFVGYRIPQVGKEFDLLRFGKNHHIDIELKSTSDEDTILK